MKVELQKKREQNMILYLKMIIYRMNMKQKILMLKEIVGKKIKKEKNLCGVYIYRY